MPFVAPVEGARVPREEGSHGPGQGPPAGAHQEVQMVGQQGPGVDGPGAARREGCQPRDEFPPVPVVPEDDPTLDPAHHHVVEDVGRIEARPAGHGGERIRHEIACQR